MLSSSICLLVFRAVFGVTYSILRVSKFDSPSPSQGLDVLLTQKGHAGLGQLSAEASGWELRASDV